MVLGCVFGFGLLRLFIAVVFACGGLVRGLPPFFFFVLCFFLFSFLFCAVLSPEDRKKRKSSSSSESSGSEESSKSISSDASEGQVFRMATGIAQKDSQLRLIGWAKRHPGKLASMQLMRMDGKIGPFGLSLVSFLFFRLV